MKTFIKFLESQKNVQGMEIALIHKPYDTNARLVFADILEEEGMSLEGEILRNSDKPIFNTTKVSTQTGQHNPEFKNYNWNELVYTLATAGAKLKNNLFVAKEFGNQIPYPDIHPPVTTFGIKYKNEKQVKDLPNFILKLLDDILQQTPFLNLMNWHREQ